MFEDLETCKLPDGVKVIIPRAPNIDITAKNNTKMRNWYDIKVEETDMDRNWQDVAKDKFDIVGIM